MRENNFRPIQEELLPRDEPAGEKARRMEEVVEVDRQNGRATIMVEGVVMTFGMRKGKVELVSVEGLNSEQEVPSQYLERGRTRAAAILRSDKRVA